MAITQKQTAGLVFLAGLLAMTPAAVSAPAVFPTGVTVREEGFAEGHVLLGGQDGNVYLIDDEGSVVHSWTTLPCGWNGSIKALPGGNILTKSCASAMELNWFGSVVWEYIPTGGVILHHDSARLPNGNTLLLGRRNSFDSAISNLTIREDLLLEVSPTGQVVWDWYEVDHFEEFGFSQERLDLIYELGGDWSHCNTIAPIPENTSHTDPRFMPGNIVISIRHQNTIAVIDRVTSEIVWVLTDETVGQHTTHMIPDDLPGGGNILAFDNGWAVNRSVIPNRYYSRIVEIDPLTDTLQYEYTADASGLHIGSFFSSAKSGVQRQANGNTLITEAKSGRVFEVTPAGQIVWEYVSPYFNPAGVSNEVYRAYKVPLDWAGTMFAPDLVVSARDTPGAVEAGEALEYTIRLENAGRDPAIHVELAAAVPLGATFSSLNAPAGWSCSTPAVGEAGAISCTASSLGAGSAEEFGITVDVDPCAGSDTTVRSLAEASSIGDETFTTNNSTTIETKVSCP